MSRESAFGCRAAKGRMKGVDVLRRRILLLPSEPERSRRFYRGHVGAAVYRESGHPDDRASCSFSAASTGSREWMARTTSASIGLAVSGQLTEGLIQAL